MHSELGVNTTKFNCKSPSYFAGKLKKRLDKEDEDTNAYLQVISERFNTFYGPFKNRHYDWYFIASADNYGIFGGVLLSLNFAEKSLMIVFMKEDPEEVGGFRELMHKEYSDYQEVEEDDTVVTPP